MCIKKFDLKQLRDYFYDIGEKTWGQTLQIDMLEEVFKPVRDGKEELSLKHIKPIKDDYAFANWWKMPEISEEDLSPCKSVIAKLRPHDKEAISKLFDLLKNIEIVSCLFRFIDPQNYGILSPPVENILNVRGKNQIEKYLNYLQNLEELKDEYNFVRIADVDMALWVLANILNYSHLKHHPDYYDIYDAYEQTANPVKILMAKNSFDQIEQEKPLYKAELFLDSDYVVSGLIAGRELELFVKDLCRKNRFKSFEIRHCRIPELAEKLANKKVITKEEEADIKSLWKIRCALTHEDEKPVTQENVSEMIEYISRLKEKHNSY